MTQTNDTCLGGRPGGARHPGAARIATRRTRTRVSSDAVVSAYIHDIARPYTGREHARANGTARSSTDRASWR